MFTLLSFKDIENKHDVYRGIKTFGKTLKEHAMKILKLKNLTSKHQESYEYAKVCYIFEEKLEDKYVKDKRGAAHSICNLKSGVPTETKCFQNGSSHYYYFIIRVSRKI